MAYSYINRGYTPLLYKLKNLPVFFNDEACLNMIEKVIDENGKFIQYPGLVEDDRWLKEKRVGLHEEIRYEAQFFLLEDHRYLMLWLVQPDGRYWMDEDGFGIEDDLSVMFYSLLNENGEFLKPFELFSIENTRYIDEFERYLK